MADQSLASIEDQLANARTQALSQGMTAEQAEAHARSVVFGDDADAAERYDLLKADHAESLAGEDLQAQGQAITAADLAGVRASLGQTVAAGQQKDADFKRKGAALRQIIAEQNARRDAEAAELTGHVEASMGYPVGLVSGEEQAPTDITPQDYGDMQQGLRNTWERAEGRKVEDERRDEAGAARYEMQKQAVTDLAKRRLAEQERSKVREMLTTALGLGEQQERQNAWTKGRDFIDAALNPAAEVYGETPAPFLPDEPGTSSEYQRVIAADEAAARAKGVQIEDLEARTGRDIVEAEMRQAAAAKAQEAATFKAKEERQAAMDEELRQAKQATDRADRLDRAALMVMMSAQQPIGPSTIGEAMSGKYGQRQAQVSADINTARTFFEKSGKIRRDKMTERERKRKAQRAERADTTRRFLVKQRTDAKAKRDKANRESRLEIAKLRTSASLFIAEGKLNALWDKLDNYDDIQRQRLAQELARFGQLKKIRRQEGGIKGLNLFLGSARNNYNSYERSLARLARTKAGLERNIAGQKAAGYPTQQLESQLQAVEDESDVARANLSESQDAMEVLEAAITDNYLTTQAKPPPQRSTARKAWRQ